MKLSFDQVIRVLRIVLILFFCSWALVWFSIRAERKNEKDRSFADYSVRFLGDVPKTIKLWWQSTRLEPQEIVLDSDAQIRKLGELKDCASLHDELYLLHYRYEGNHTGKVYLQNIKSGKIARSWNIPLEEIFEDIRDLKREMAAEFKDGRIPVQAGIRIKNNIPSMPIRAPVMTADSSLLFNIGDAFGYIYKLDQYSNLVWKSEDLSHHSIELDAQGDIWTCSVNLKYALADEYKFREDAILCLGQDGRKKFFASLSQILTENELFDQLIATTPSNIVDYGSDPYHLNDVEPMKQDGRFWKKGDLFLSIRNKSLVVQYRPEENSVVWYQQGPWLAQHDIKAVNEAVISIFNNNVAMVSEMKFRGDSSSLAYYNFEDGTTEFVGQGVFSSKFQGRQIPTVGGYTLVEIPIKAFYVLLDPDGNEQCRFYIPYYSNPSHGQYGCWARLYLKQGSEFVLQ